MPSPPTVANALSWTTDRVRTGPANQTAMSWAIRTGLRARWPRTGLVWLRSGGAFEDGADNIDAAAVAAYRTSIETGRPLSERKLAQMFGKTSRRWARNRMAEARQSLKPAMSGSR